MAEGASCQAPLMDPLVWGLVSWPSSVVSIFKGSTMVVTGSRVSPSNSSLKDRHDSNLLKKVSYNSVLPIMLCELLSSCSGQDELGLSPFPRYRQKYC